MAKEYYIDGELYTVEEENENEFLEEFPDAKPKEKEVKKYNVDGEERSVDINSIEEFESEFPDATPLTGKSNSSVKSANTEQPTVAQNLYDDTEFKSESILSESQLNNQQDFNKTFGPMPEITTDITHQPEEFAIKDLRDKWMEYGFTFEQKTIGMDRIEVTALNGESKIFNIGMSTTNHERAAKEMNDWMKKNADHQGDKLEAFLSHVSVNQDQVNEIKPNQSLAQKQIDELREAWGLDGHSDAAVLKEYDKFITAQSANKSMSYDIKDPNYANWKLSDAYKNYTDKKSKLEGTTLEKDFRKNRTNLDVIINGKEGYRKEEALKKYQTQTGVKLDGMYDEDGGLTKKGIDILNSKEYKNIYNALKVDKDKEQEYVDNFFEQDQMNKYLEENLKEQIEKFSNNPFVKSDTQKELIELAVDKREAMSKQNTKKVNEFNVVYGDLENIYNEIGGNADWLNSIGDGTKKLEELKSKYDLTTQEGVDGYNAEVKQFRATYQEKLDRFNFLQKKRGQYEKFANKIGKQLDNTNLTDSDMKTVIGALKRNYQQGTVMAGQFTNAVIDLGQGIAEAGDWLLSMPREVLKAIDNPGVEAYSKASKTVNTENKTRKWDEWNDWLDNWQQEKINDRIEKPTRFEDINSLSDIGEWSSGVIASQIPILATMWATGGYSLWIMGASSTGSKWRQLNDAKDEYERTGGLYGNNHSWGSMFTNALFTGTTEALSEKITLGQMNKFKGILKNSKAAKLGWERHLKQNVFTWNNAKAGAKDVFEEGFSESVAQVSSNFADVLSGVEDANVWDGVAESFVSGMLISQGMKVPSLGRAMSAPFRSKDTNEKTGEITSKIEDLSKRASKLPKESKERLAIEEEIVGLTKEANDLIEQDIKRVGLLKDHEKKALVNIEKQNYNARKRAEEIMLDSKLSDKEKFDQIKKLNEKVSMRQVTKQNILSQYGVNVINSNYAREMDTMKRQTELANKQGGVQTVIEEVGQDEFTDINTKELGDKSKAQVDDYLMERQAEIEALRDVLKDKNASKEAKSDAQQKLAEAKKQEGTAKSLLAEGNDYGVMIPVFDKNRNLVSMRVVVNKDLALTDGKLNTGAHEFLHAAMRMTMKGDPRMRKVMGKKMQEIIDSGKMTFKGDARIEYEARMKMYRESQKGEESFTILSEMMRDGKVQINESTTNKFKDFFRRWSKNYTKRDIEFNETQDVLNFIKDFDYNLKNNIVSPALARMMAHGAKGEMFKGAKETKEREAMKSFDHAVDLNRRGNPDLKREFDQFILNEDGTPKYVNHEEFKNSPDYGGAMLHLLEGRAHDGLIMQGASDSGVQPERMREFVRNVKEELARMYSGGLNKKSTEKIAEIEELIKKKEILIKDGVDQIEKIKNNKSNYLREFNYDAVGDGKVSLFGWLTGTYRAIWIAKENVKKQWVKDQPGFGGPSLDKQISTKEGTSTLKDVIGGEGDSAFDAIDNMDLSFGRKNAAKEILINEIIISDALNFTPDVMNSITNTIKSASIDIGALIKTDGPYKGIKRLLDDVTKFTKIDKKTGKPQVYKTGKNKGEVKLFPPTSEKKTEPIGPLFEILNAVSTEFGVDPLRILSTQDLDGDQRRAAQAYILDKSINEDGSFDDTLFKMLPEGEDKSGWATGVANTNLGDFYIKGDRVKVGDGADKKGGQKYAQEKRSNIGKDEFLSMFGINPNGSFRSGTDADGSIRELVKQIAVISANQMMRIDAVTNGTATEAVAAKLADGKSEAVFSKKLDPRNIDVYEDLWSEAIGTLHHVNMDDLESIESHLSSIYGDMLSRREINGIAQDWYDWKKEFDELESTKNRDSIVDAYDIQTFIIGKTERTLLESGLLNTYRNKFVTDTRSVSELFLDPERVNKRRGDVIKLVNKWRAEGKSVDEILRSLYFARGMYSSANKAGDGRLVLCKSSWCTEGTLVLDPKWEDKLDEEGNIIEYGSKWRRYNSRSKAVKEGKAKVGDVIIRNGKPVPEVNRGQVFVNTQDLINTISQAEGFEDIKNKTWTEIKNEKGLNLSMFQEKSKNAIEDQDYDGRLAQAKENRSIVEDLVKMYAQGIYEGTHQYEDIVMLGRMLGSNMDSPMKRAANLAYIGVGVGNVKNPGTDLEYEHMKPTNKKIMETIEALLNDPSGLPSDHWDDYQVAIIPKDMDKVLIAAGLRDFMQLGYKRGMEVWRRYFNPQTWGRPGMVPIRNIQTGEVIGGEFVKMGDKVVKREKQNVIQEANVFSESMKSKKIPEIKGMSAFDFDETLIIDGKNVIEATNPKTGERETISSEDWPTRGTELMEQGWEFDFSDFINVKGGTKGPLFQKLKNRIQKFGSKNNFILTARPQESAAAIHGWLMANGIYLPPENITGLGQSSGDAKAMWILDKFKEGYNDVYFVDDALPNVDAVKHVMEQLDMKGSSVQAVLDIKGKTLLPEVVADEFTKAANNARKQIDIIEKDLKKKGYEIIGTVRSSEFRRVGGLKIDLTTKEGREISKELDNIKTVSSSEFKSKNNESMKSRVVDTHNAINEEFNDMLERASGIDSKRVITADEAKKSKGDLSIFQKFFVPPSAEDFKGLLYNFLGKGKRGDKDFGFFKKYLLEPFANGVRDYNAFRQNMANDYAALKKSMPNTTKSFDNKIGDSVFTNEDAIRVYLWNKAGHTMPGLSETQIEMLINHVNSNSDLMGFAEGLSRITKGYGEPDLNWAVTSIAGDLKSIANSGRTKFLADWIANKDIVFSKDNLNKIESIYGAPTREALEDIMYRMETGSNRPTGQNRIVNKFLNWINGSVGAVMFFNTRSALLQTISTVNFINWEDNNIFKAAAAFANQPQFWSDFAMIFNSDMLKQRRSGLQIDVNYNELSEAYKGGRSKPEAVIRFLLEKGFLPTQIADSFAIAMGGASFYRNRLKSLIKQGMHPEQAAQQAWKDFQEIAEETQQSSRPDLISQQQAGVLGRLILAWQNTPMQMTRLTKKALSDLVNGRGSFKANVSRIMYYGLIQNIIFGVLQTGLAFLMFGGDDEEEEKKKKTERVLNGAFDTLLRGTGVWGAAVSTLKNTIMKFYEQREKGWNADQTYTIIEAINLSPPLGSKFRKIYNAIQTDKFNRGVGEKLKYRIENPTLSIVGNVVEALTNLPMARLINKANNIEEAVTGNHELWQRMAMLGGWNRWSVGAEDEELEAAKKEVKDEKKEKKKIEKENKKIEDKKKKDKEKKDDEEKKKKDGIKTVRCSGVNSSGKRCGMTTETKAKSWKCVHHMEFKDGMDRDNDGLKEYRCTATTSSGKRCKNKTENKNKKCYAHQ